MKKLSLFLILAVYFSTFAGVSYGLLQPEQPRTKVLGNLTECVPNGGYCKENNDCCSRFCEPISWIKRLPIFRKLKYSGRCMSARQPKPTSTPPKPTEPPVPTYTPEPTPAQGRHIDCSLLKTRVQSIQKMIRELSQLQERLMNQSERINAECKLAPTSTPKPTSTPEACIPVGGNCHDRENDCCDNQDCVNGRCVGSQYAPTPTPLPPPHP